MRELAILTFQTLDGVMQAPVMPEEDRSGGFAAGGWAAPYFAGVMPQVLAEAMAAPYDMILGRTTYDLFAAHWPSAPADDPVGAVMNGARKHVATSRPDGLDWANSAPLGGEVPEAVAALKAQAGPLLQVHGSWALVQTLLRHDLVDELRLWTFPVVVGAGKRLFEASPGSAKLALIKSAATADGVTMGFYRRAA